jgi:hypothetical protein
MPKQNGYLLQKDTIAQANMNSPHEMQGVPFVCPFCSDPGVDLGLPLPASASLCLPFKGALCLPFSPSGWGCCLPLAPLLSPLSPCCLPLVSLLQALVTSNTLNSKLGRQCEKIAWFPAGALGGQ